MKSLAKLSAVLAVASLTIGSAGCTTNGMAKVINAAAKDPASVHVEFSGWGVTARYDRNNSMPNTNTSGSVTLTPVTTLRVSQ